MGIYSESLVRLQVREGRDSIFYIPCADLYKVWHIVPGTFCSLISYRSRWQNIYSYMYHYKGICLKTV